LAGDFGIVNIELERPLESASLQAHALPVDVVAECGEF